MVLPAIAMGLMRGAAVLGRGLVVASRGAVRLFGRGASAVGGAFRRGFKAITKPRMKKPRTRRPKGKKPVKRKPVKRPILPKKEQVTIEMIHKFFKDHPKRVEAVKHRILKEITTHVMDDVKARLPRDQTELRDSLQLGVLPGRDPIYAVRSVAKRQKLNKREGGTTLLYVQRSSSFLRNPAGGVQVLIRHNPWTLDTLPYMPKRKDAVIVKRRADKKEVKKVRKMRMRDKVKWKASLDNAGIRQTAQLKPSQIEALSDLGHQSIQMEFGLGSQSAPHWRPAVLWAFRGGAMEVFGHPDIMRAMVDPKFTKWKSWKAPARHFTQKQIEELVPFQQKLGIKG